MAAIDVIIPTFRRRKLLSRAIRSVLAQSFQDFRIIVIDDNGINSDGVEPWVRSHPKVDMFSTAKLNREGCAGAAAARNVGLDGVKSGLLTFLDDDDELFPHFLQETVDFHQRNQGERVISCGHVVNIFDKVALMGELQISNQSLESSEFAKIGIGQGVALQLKGLSSSTRFNEKLKTVEDTDFIYQLIISGYHATRLSEARIGVNHHSGSRLTDHAHNFVRAKECALLLETHQSFLNSNPLIADQLNAAILKLTYGD